jgi:hypothetical protein
MNGRGVTAQDGIPPAIFGFNEGEQGINPYVYDWEDGQARRKPLQAAMQFEHFLLKTVVIGSPND